MKIIEELGVSDKLYHSLKRQGVYYIKDIYKIDYRKLTKEELIELLEEFADYSD